MTDSSQGGHVSHATAGHGHDAHGDSGHGSAGHGVAADLKFEPSELVYFQSEDKEAGQVLGKLLAGIFMVLVVLMMTAASWGLSHRAETQNPHERAAAVPASH